MRPRSGSDDQFVARCASTGCAAPMAAPPKITRASVVYGQTVPGAAVLTPPARTAPSNSASRCTWSMNVPNSTIIQGTLVPSSAINLPGLVLARRPPLRIPPCDFVGLGQRQHHGKCVEVDT